ncbi:hypothetical protein [Dactylosporangium matsuzakiense]|uniref:Uncharacterized protein n=1 Tax=Dactylosporangium matsuzakiense TaxID=53360 RepID=A0A9W6NM21_9ACTN|nr:hypothetical protein [Dactylosporangium matsuzakiense]UWZ48234.1 hypothetical protein Dmats_18590 [Dactylosporangium matsuzakiense]GLL01467.1 hypothetical protein GCM10017581_032080 [Dactylosporangium matsuzakiense]
MAATMIVAALVAGVYAALITMHVAAIRHDATANVRRPGLARWLAAAGERRRGHEECTAVQRRMAGDLGRAAYRGAMEALAARDAVEHPLQVPKARR